MRVNISRLQELINELEDPNIRSIILKAILNQHEIKSLDELSQLTHHIPVSLSNQISKIITLFKEQEMSLTALNTVPAHINENESKIIDKFSQRLKSIYCLDNTQKPLFTHSIFANDKQPIYTPEENEKSFYLSADGLENFHMKG